MPASNLCFSLFVNVGLDRSALQSTKFQVGIECFAKGEFALPGRPT